MKKIQIFPSLISANLLNLEHEIKLLEPYCDGFHLDVMDNHFVPNLTWGHMFVNAIAQKTKKIMSIHLMIDNIDHFLPKLTLPPKSILSFHPETVKDFSKTINFIKEKKWTPSIAISPKIDLEKMFPFLAMPHHVLLMSVEPGYSGQQFMPSSIERLKTLVKFGKEKKIDLTIAMDGGINTTNIKELAQLGVTEFCIAAGIFDQPDAVKAIKKLYAVAQAQ